MTAQAPEHSVLLAEKFASVQGEGPLAGQACAFVRFSRCNLSCGWCDEKPTWDWSRYRPEQVSSRVAVGELVDWVRGCEVDLLVITGGEPMLQQPAMAALAAGVRAERAGRAGMRVQVETNGTQAPQPGLGELVDLWVVSPKLAHSGVDYERRIVPAALAALCDTGRAVFKFVVTDPEVDIPQIEALVAEFGIAPGAVWLMPEGVSAQVVRTGATRLAGPAGERGWRVSTRQHILDGVR